MQDIIDRVSRMKGEEPCHIIDNTSRYKKIVYFFKNNLVLYFEELGEGTIIHTIKPFDFEIYIKNYYKFNYTTDHQKALHAAYQDWFIEQTLLVD